MQSTAKPLSILHLLAPAPFGGLETVVATLAWGQARAGERVTVGLVVGPEEAQGHPLAQELDGLAVVIEVRGRDYRVERRAVDDLLVNREVDVLHTHGYRPDVVDAGVARRRGIATVSTVHGFVGGSLRNRLYEWIQLQALRRFDAVIAVSEPLGVELARRGVADDRVHVVPNAWRPPGEPLPKPDARRRLGLEEEGRVIGWVGRLSPEKAPDVMIRALPHVEDVAASLSMVGSGPMDDEVRLLATELGVSGRLRWHGAVPAAGRLLKAFDVLVLSSWTEGTPMVLLEAMAAGVPIVTTRVGGVPHVVSEGEARLCPAGRPRAIAAAVEDVLTRPEAAAERVRAALRRVAEGFAVDGWIPRHREIYDSIIQR